MAFRKNLEEFYRARQFYEYDDRLRMISETREFNDKLADDSYRKSGVLIHIKYSSAPCSDNNRGKYNIPKDTVFRYQVIFAPSKINKIIYINQLPFDLEKYERYESEHEGNRVYYGRRDKGVSFEAIITEDGEYLSNMTYFPSTEVQSKYKCAK